MFLKGESSGSEARLPNLPQEVIAEILLWLPVKSICRFRCVCKHFFSLLSDPQFVRSHLDRVLGNDDLRFRSQRILLYPRTLYSLEYVSMEGKCGFFKGVKLDWVGSVILGSSNGLVCFSQFPHHEIYFLNPATRESKQILKPYRPIADCESYGFGYDPVHDDYKIVTTRDYNVAPLVYSLRHDVWREVERLPYHFGYNVQLSGVSFNGLLHWVVADNDGYYVILVFDLLNETFREIPMPDDANECGSLVVIVHDGCLCLTYTCDEDSVEHNDIWLMREYGVAESWTRARVCIGEPYGCTRPVVCSWRNGEVLLQLKRSFIMYDLKNGTSRQLMVNGVPDIYRRSAHSYVESLISPNKMFNRSELR